VHPSTICAVIAARFTSWASSNHLAVFAGRFKIARRNRIDDFRSWPEQSEDDDARQKAEVGGEKYALHGIAWGNAFVLTQADVAAGPDGNVYLLHGTSPALVYVISPAGEVVRKLRIATEDPNREASSIKFYARRLAIGFDWVGNAPRSLIKVTDLRGNSIADYEIGEGAGDSDPILACYGSKGFTLIPRSAETKLHLREAKLP
jgi:hypothetical protein